MASEVDTTIFVQLQVGLQLRFILLQVRYFPIANGATIEFYSFASDVATEIFF
jgi:hypothetical protein